MEHARLGMPEAGTAEAVSPRGRFFVNQTFHFETLRNAGYIVANCANLGEVLETVKCRHREPEANRGMGIASWNSYGKTR
jgi:hypothetical protein